MTQHGFETFQYADRSIAAVSRLDALQEAGGFPINQMARLTLLVIALVAMRRLVRRQQQGEAEHASWANELSAWDRSFLLWVGLVPLVSTVILSIILGTQLRASWATTFFMLFGFYCFVWLRDDNRVVLRSALIAVMVMHLCMVPVTKLSV